jgi:predicted transcriptional regulator
VTRLRFRTNLNTNSAIHRVRNLLDKKFMLKNKEKSI